MTNWTAVSNHLATVVMQWQINGLGLTWCSRLNGKEIIAKEEWQPHKRWDHAGKVIDKMKEGNYPYLSVFYSREQEECVAYFYNTNTKDNFVSGKQETEQKAIALAAALATEYVEKEKTEAEILLDKLFQAGLSHATGIEERILELFEQSFEKVRREEEQRQSRLIKELRLIIKELRLIDKEKNDEGRLLLEIRARLRTKGDSACPWLTVTEEAILKSIEKWDENRYND